MNIAIFGGAFNPIHKAHTTLAENVLKECNVEKVIFIPTFISPHRRKFQRQKLHIQNP